MSLFSHLALLWGIAHFVRTAVVHLLKMLRHG